MPETDPLIINEAQLILAEKRTSLASLRTGIAVMALPMTLVSFLIAASQFYHAAEVLGLLVPLMLACLGLFCLGAYLALRAMLKLHREERLLGQLKRQSPIIAKFLD